MKDRPEELPCWVTEIQTGYGKVYMTVTEMNGKPFEVFITIGKSGGAVAAKGEVIGRLLSIALRNDIPVQELIDQMKGIRDDKPQPDGKDMIWSIPDGIAKALEKRYG